MGLLSAQQRGQVLGKWGKSQKHRELGRAPVCQTWADYSFGEHGFEHRSQWVFWTSPSSREEKNPMELPSQPIICVPRRTRRVSRRTQRALAQNSAQNSVNSLFRNCTLETLSRPFPIVGAPRDCQGSTEIGKYQTDPNSHSPPTRVTLEEQRSDIWRTGPLEKGPLEKGYLHEVVQR